MSATRPRSSRLPLEALATPATFMVASSRGRLVIPRHIAYIEDAVLRAIARGDALLTIEAPVRHGKSFYTDWKLPAWYLGSFPHKHVGLASHEARFAAGWGAKARDDLLEFGSSFGIRISRDISARAEWEIDGWGGGMSSVGIRGGGITGRGFDLFVLDDLIKNAADADSEVIRESQWEFLRGTAMTRLEPGGVLIVTMARWHEDDLIGRIHREMPGQFERIRLPALAETDDPLGRAEGEPLWPERFPVANLERRRDRSGSYYFNALYQQRPSPPEGTIFRRESWRWYDDAPLAFDSWCWSWDAAFKGEEDSSFVVGQVWGKLGADFYLLHQVRGQWDYPTTKTTLAAQVSDPRWSAAASQVFIEDKANGPAIIADLAHQVGGLIPVATGNESKTARARSISGYIEAGNVYLPLGAPWADAFVDEAAGFPRGAHDDQVDAMSQALREMLERGGGSAWSPAGDLPLATGRAW